MTLHRRLEYTLQVLDSLRACFAKSGPLPTALFVDCGPEEVANAARSFAEEADAFVRVDVAGNHLGCNANTFRALRDGFTTYDSVIALEDDTVLAPDALEYFLWGLAQYKNDSSVFSISGYHRTTERDDEKLYGASRRQWFTPWGWATWADRFADIENSLAVKSVPPGQSWDVYVNQNARSDRYEVYPALSRVQNIGATDGQHVPSPEWHKQNQHCPIFAGQFAHIPQGSWVEA